MKADFAASLGFQNCYESPMLLCGLSELGLWPSVITVLESYCHLGHGHVGCGLIQLDHAGNVSS